MHMKGAVACRDGPSPDFSVCFSAGQCFPARGEDNVLLLSWRCSHAPSVVTLRGGAQGVSFTVKMKSVMKVDITKRCLGGCPKQHALSGNEWT